MAAINARMVTLANIDLVEELFNKYQQFSL